MRALKARVIVELSIRRQAKGSPMAQDEFQGVVGTNGLARPGRQEAAVQGNAVEDLNVKASFEDEPLDHIEGIHFGEPPDDIGKIPAGGWWRSARAAAAIENAASFENASDGSHRWRLSQVSFQEFLMDGHRADLPQIAGLQGAAQVQNQVFHFRGNPAIASWGFGSVRPIDTVEPLPLGALDPALDRAQANSQSPSHGTKGEASASQANDLHAQMDLGVFLCMGSSKEVSRKCRENLSSMVRDGVFSRGPQLPVRPTASFRCGPREASWNGPGDSHVVALK